MTHPRGSRRAALALAALAALGLPVVAAAAPAAPSAAPSHQADGSPAQAWLLSVRDGQADRVAGAVRAAGGSVLAELPDVGVVSVRLPSGTADAVVADPSVLGARRDTPVGFAAGATRAAPTRNVYRETTRADRAYGAGATGSGTTVALIDTGIASLPQLERRVVPVALDGGRTARCMNFTDEPCGDGYGHGTFLASLIAGNGTGSVSGTSHRGMADANLLDVKIAGAAGSASTSTLLAAIQWVVTNKSRYGVKVLNLSLGTPSGASVRVDPLNYAVQRAVDAGITVVVSAGNTGPDPRTVTKPGDDPHVLTVGASDDLGTSFRADDVMPRFSAQGPTRTDGLAKPDVVAPGARLIGLRSPGSLVEQKIPGGVDLAYRGGSGTSMAAAVVSGAAAQLLSARPGLSPAQVKAALRATATPVRSEPATRTGAGLVNVRSALDWDGTAPQSDVRSTGSGALTDTAGGLVSMLDVPTLLDALVSDADTAVDMAEYLAERSWVEDAWRDGQFASTNWQSTNWQSTNWQSTNWQSTNWQSTNWQSTNWQSTNWQSTNWQGTTEGEEAAYGTPGGGSANLGAWE